MEISTASFKFQHIDISTSAQFHFTFYPFSFCFLRWAFIFTSVVLIIQTLLTSYKRVGLGIVTLQYIPLVSIIRLGSDGNHGMVPGWSNLHYHVRFPLAFMI